MDPLSALSIACNAMQVISFGLETISLCKEIYESGHLDLGLVESGRHLEGIGRSLTQQLKHRSKSLTAEDKAFIKVANQCADDARALQKEAAYLAPKKKHEIRGAIMAAGRSLWHRKKLKKLEENLSRSQRLLETCLLGRICDESQANAIQNRNDFANLDRTLQDFVKQYADGQRTLSGLLQTSFQALTDQVIKDSNRTRQEVTAHITNELLSHHKGIEDNIIASTAKVPQEISDNIRAQEKLAIAAQQRQRLLESLQYSEMNARYNGISETCPETFEWVLNPDASEADDLGHPRTTLLEWLRSDEKLFWISGKPGSGKSTLTKFIVMHPETQKALEQWRQKTRIVSHFFWLPGSEIQKSIHGMLCSLLHQLLLEYFSALELEEKENKTLTEGTVLLRFPQLKKKTTHWDWSTTELTKVMFYHLESSPVTYCLFLDGLDEVFPKDGPQKLLEVLDCLLRLPSVKLCVSSRPEHIFKTRFENFPFLKMQDLIAPDIRKYAYEMFKEQTEPSVLPGRVDYIVSTIVAKADGVFLWAVLVLESCKRGLFNGDTWDELQRRLNTVPTDLMDLYRDMWSRLGEDQVVYRKTAALYISLLMRYKRLDTWERYLFSIKASNQLTVMEFMAASSSLPELEELLGHRPQDPTLDLEKKCEQTRKNIDIRCAGLLIIRPRKGAADLDRTQWWQSVCREPSYGQLLRYLPLEVDFVHRSAYDFLIDTEDGRQIWKECGLTDFQLLCQLVRGHMARLRVLSSIASWMREYGVTRHLGIIGGGFEEKQIVPCCRELFRATVGQRVTSAQAEILFSILSWASINGYLITPTDRSIHDFARPRQFLALASLNFDTFVEDFIMSHARSLTAETLCYILVDMCSDMVFPRNATVASFPRTISCIVRCIELHSKSCCAASDTPVDIYVQIACGELLRIVFCKWPMKYHRDIILDSITKLLSAGADLDRRLYIGVWCNIGGSLQCDLINHGTHHLDDPSVFHLQKSLADSFMTKKILDMELFRLYGLKGGYSKIPVLLEVSLSFAIECAISRLCCKRGDRPAPIGHEGHQQHCRIVSINFSWIQSKEGEADDDDLSKLTSLLSSGLTEDPVFQQTLDFST